MFGEIKRIHFVGIGGIGMSGIAEVLNSMGYSITGSDLKESSVTKYLKDLGIKITIGHSKKNVYNADVLVYSSAVRPDNVEILEARRRKIPVIPRAEMLAELMRMKFSIAIAGSHGKTTTTSMVGQILLECGADPTIIVGGKLRIIGTNARLGKGKYLVAEADESDRTFLKLFPTISIITSIDEEHLDRYIDIKDIKNAFIDFANRVPFFGTVYLCYEDKNAIFIRNLIEKRVVTYGLSLEADIKGLELKRDGFYYSFLFQGNGTKFGRVKLNVPGIHNVLNAVAAIGVGLELGFSFDKVKNAIEHVEGVISRFEIKAKTEEFLIVDDYAHHPREIESVLKTAREGWKGRIIAIFQPHLFSRTILLKDRFGKAFFDADLVYITDIYPSREERIPGITGKIISDAIKGYGHKNVRYIENMDDIYKELADELKPGDMIITMGAGNINRVGEKIADYVKNKR